MKASAVWIDRKQAKIAHYPRSFKGESFKAIAVENHDREVEELGVKREQEQLFELLAQRLKDSADILILGPGVAKYHFRNFLNEQHPLVARKVGLFQAMDYPTEEAMQAFVERYLWAKMPAASGS